MKWNKKGFIVFFLQAGFLSFKLIAQQSFECSVEDLQVEKESRQKAFRQMYSNQGKIENVNLGSCQLYEIQSRITLLIFWKTDCPYCKNLLETVSDLLENNKQDRLQVIAVCLNNENAAWEKHPFVTKKYSNLINLNDGKGYFGELAKQLHVYATPTLLIIDNNHEILPLPKNVEQLKILISDKVNI